MLDIEEALDRTVWRTRSGLGCGPVVRHYVMMVYQKWIWFSRWFVISTYHNTRCSVERDGNCASVVALLPGSAGERDVILILLRTCLLCRA
jgi:hypothetical protein